MLLEKILPYLPVSSLPETLVYVVAGAGIVFLTYGIFLEVERRQDLVLLLGACCLIVYALYIRNLIFTLAMAGIAIGSLIEFLEIYFGLHKHSPEDLERYKKLG
ncbi:MAG: hypothetical protein A2821_01775 [Candidatus Magasanikbacteria bacterium RIFCSPHIGHO2_01_FULL_41_23]|uniref:Uncharacterized protein n=1 Tax=Candidatus Magasanikbacteria bacterium RIFCSPLOWO2_01_FULL_40_15 TaxID=1798686 RepID=A0A1F6N2S6_9BACT|nr:MAG: hypothetical protein A2821_01775 [Candidatus Magasanikbacteria bacterium RIFCSPHIGHO2_01_FULL_41_23]OGH75052.1 MAG: hypothetical protein A3F22_00485 [Candidatus Magasanikbacteria bacterium RIFCSPHIGHO2_12_FULL_41_16]OGH78306.1 MAG: hypothetical protein A2983_04090 [Candidatus Magasanikbacteria bacterium RIFCSPLOWO2_01_FULL_40_15]